MWQRVQLNWYGGQQRAMALATGTAVWFHNGKPPVPIRWVLVCDPAGEYDAVALLSTDDERDACGLWHVLFNAGRWR